MQRPPEAGAGVAHGRTPSWPCPRARLAAAPGCTGWLLSPQLPVGAAPGLLGAWGLCLRLAGAGLGLFPDKPNPEAELSGVSIPEGCAGLCLCSHPTPATSQLRLPHLPALPSHSPSGSQSDPVKIRLLVPVPPFAKPSIHPHGLEWNLESTYWS